MMEILFVSHKYPPSVGGMERQSFELINGMGAHAKVHAVIYDGKRGRLRFFLSLQNRILRLCGENPGISIIHFNDATVAAFCLRHRGYSHLRRTVTVHGLDVVFPNYFYQRYIFPKFVKFDLVFAVSQATADACIERGLPPGKITVVNNGVDTRIASIKKEVSFAHNFQVAHGIDLYAQPVFVSIGRAVKRKGFSWFIKNVLPRIRQGSLFVIVGPFNPQKTVIERVFQLLPVCLKNQLELFLGYPSDETGLRALLADKVIGKNVKHVGKLPFDEIVQLLQQATAFVMPNISVPGDMEGFGLVCLEASLCGALVFAASSGGIPDAVHHNSNGVLLPPGDADAWVSALNSLVENPEAHSINAAEGKYYTRHSFSWNIMVEKYNKFFLDCVGK